MPGRKAGERYHTMGCFTRSAFGRCDGDAHACLVCRRSLRRQNSAGAASAPRFTAATPFFKTTVGAAPHRTELSRTFHLNKTAPPTRISRLISPPRLAGGVGLRRIKHSGELKMRSVAHKKALRRLHDKAVAGGTLRCGGESTYTSLGPPPLSTPLWQSTNI